ncbi:MAG: TetR/AcrR family transcriptional regulator [Pseudomonadota bacterium]
MATSSLTAKGSSTRSRILAEARGLLVTGGYQRVVLRAVAEACGIKLGNLQYYFPTLDALLLAVIELEGQKDLETIRRAVDQQQDPVSALRAIAAELVTRWRSDSGGVYATLNLLSLHHPDYRALYKRIYADHYGALAQVIAAAAPGLPKTEYDQRARLMTALIDGAAYQQSAGRKAQFLSRVVETACALALGDR